MPNVHNGGTRFSVGTGAKRFLGFVETDTENATVLTPFLRSLIERGLDLSQGVLVILDGGKGLRTAVRKAFRGLCATSPMGRNCEGDGGRSFGGGMQVQPSNHLKLLWPKAMVVSVEEKAPGRRQV